MASIDKRRASAGLSADGCTKGCPSARGLRSRHQWRASTRRARRIATKIALAA